jgi:hypothetical protein
LICGWIEYIVNLDCKLVFAIQCQLSALIRKVDPFDQYPHFPAASHAPGLAEELEIVEVGCIACYYAWWQYSTKLALVFPLLPVCLA